VENPIRSERAAFRMVLVALVYFGLIGIASKIDRWLGVVVFAGLTAGGIVWLLRSRRTASEPRAARRASNPGERRILVVAVGDAVGPELLDELQRRHAAGPRAVIQIVSSGSGEQLGARLLAMRGAGLDVTGEVVDSDPVPAIDEAVRRFEPHELLVSAGPDGAEPWLGPGFVDRARDRFDLPVSGLVVDTDVPA
jgi:hypothetical protein